MLGNIQGGISCFIPHCQFHSTKQEKVMRFIVKTKRFSNSIQLYHQESAHIDSSRADNYCTSCHRVEDIHQHDRVTAGIGSTTPGFGISSNINTDGTMSSGVSGGFGIGGHVTSHHNPDPGPHISVGGGSSTTLSGSPRTVSVSGGGTTTAQPDNTRVGRG